MSPAPMVRRMWSDVTHCPTPQSDPVLVGDNVGSSANKSVPAGTIFLGWAAATMRRLEVRIGQVLGKAKPGRPETSSVIEDSLTKDERHAFRQMADNAEVVEEIIAESDDDRRVIRDG